MKSTIAVIGLFLSFFFIPQEKALATSCSSQWTWAVGSCPDYTSNGNSILNIQPQNANDSSFGYVRISQETVTASGLTECVVGGDVDSSCLFAVVIQKLKTMQAAINALGGGSRTFNYPSRALNSCFQISSTKDSDFHYKVDVTNALSLTTGAQGTVTATSYTNSGCTTGTQAIADGTSSQTGTLVVGLALNQTASISLDGTLPSGKWIKITTANTVGTPSFTIRAVQSEVIYP